MTQNGLENFYFPVKNLTKEIYFPIFIEKGSTLYQS